MTKNSWKIHNLRKTKNKRNIYKIHKPSQHKINKFSVKKFSNQTLKNNKKIKLIKKMTKMKRIKKTTKKKWNKSLHKKTSRSLKSLWMRKF